MTLFFIVCFGLIPGTTDCAVEAAFRVKSAQWSAAPCDDLVGAEL